MPLEYDQSQLQFTESFLNGNIFMQEGVGAGRKSRRVPNHEIVKLNQE